MFKTQNILYFLLTKLKFCEPNVGDTKQTIKHRVLQNKIIVYPQYNISFPNKLMV